MRKFLLILFVLCACSPQNETVVNGYIEGEYKKFRVNINYTYVNTEITEGDINLMEVAYMVLMLPLSR